MQCPENFFSEHAADARHAGQLLYTGPTDPLQSTEMVQQGAPAAGAYARNILEGRARGGLLPAAPVAGDREAVSLVTDLLYQV